LVRLNRREHVNTGSLNNLKKLITRHMKHTSYYTVCIKNLKPMAVVLTRATVDPSGEGPELPSLSGALNLE
jgi:hypothetical protein